MSPNQVFPLDSAPLNPIAARVLREQNLTYEVSAEGVVIAVKHELLVRKSARESSPRLDQALSGIATNRGTLAGARPSEGAERGDPDVEPGSMADIEVWRISDSIADAGVNSIDAARRLRVLAEDKRIPAGKGPAPMLPAVSPNHAAILSPAFGGCPAGPPRPAPAHRDPFVLPLRDRPTARVTVLDSGYIRVDDPDESHRALDERVTLVDGERLDTTTDPASWQPDRPDGVDTDGDGRLDGIAGHGTFIAGLIAHACPEATLTVVGLRNQDIQIEGTDPNAQSGLYETEAAIARAMLLHADTDVIQCGFAFPTLDDYPSLPFASAMQVLAGDAAPRRGVAVLAPAGNEESSSPFWPAALPDVIGVASTNRHGTARARFSNWGSWCDCCTRGEDVFSAYVKWYGRIDGEPDTDVEDFDGWARWDGTSFAAPKVSAAIASLLVATDEAILPVQAAELLLTGLTGVRVTPVTDFTLTPFPGVTLPHLHLG